MPILDLFPPPHSLARIRGLLSRRGIKAVASERRLSLVGRMLRPSLDSVEAADVGVRLGRSRGVECWVSVEDSMGVVGPPRSGKGLQVVVPMILGAPGAVVTTSTRPDNLAVTLRARQEVGPVAVFDPQGLAGGVPGRLRWSPLRGCERAGTALVRARALTAGAAAGTNESSFWQSSAEQAVRCLCMRVRWPGSRRGSCIGGRCRRCWPPKRSRCSQMIRGRPGAGVRR